MSSRETLIHWLEEHLRFEGETFIEQWLQKQDGWTTEYKLQIRQQFLELSSSENVEESISTKEYLRNILDHGIFSRPPYIGDYQILAKLGEGGMGTVYLARHPKINREVALKILRKDLSSRSLRQRFELEYQFLAQLKHPNLVQLLDVGYWEEQTFFTMDFHQGLSFDQFIALNNPNAKIILDLLNQACEGLKYAHARGIIHRDIKPSNILVVASTPPRLIIIDFGIARALGQTPLLSSDPDYGHRVGTHGFMCPEQVAGQHEEVSIQLDIFALGRTMLTISGVSDFTHNQQAKNNQEPRLAAQHIAPWFSKMNKDWQCDWIALACKASDPEANARYSTIQAMIEDLQNLCLNRPISARPLNKVKRLKKYCSQKRTFLSGLSFALFIIISLSVFGIRTEIERNTIAEQSRQIAEHLDIVALAFESTIKGANAFKTKTAPSTADMLHKIEIQVEETMSPFPSFQMKSRQQLAQTYAALGEYKTAFNLFQKNRVQAQSFYGELHPITMEALERIAKTNFDLNHLSEAEAIYLELEQKSTITPINKELLLRTQMGHAVVLRTMGRLKDAKNLLEPWIESMEGDRPNSSSQLLMAKREWGNCFLDEGKVLDAKEIFTQIWMAQVETLGTNHPETLSTLENLALAQYGLTDYDNALKNLQVVYDQRVNIIGLLHPRTLRTLGHLGLVAGERADWSSAVPQLEKAFTLQREIQGETHIDTLRTAVNLARLYNAQSQFKNGESLLRFVLKATEESPGASSPEAIRARNNLADNLMHQEKYDQAELLLNLNINMLRKKSNASNIDYLSNQCTLAELYILRKDYPRAKYILIDVQSMAQKYLPKNHPWQAIFATLYGITLQELNQPNLAEQQLVGAIEAFGVQPSLYKVKALKALVQLHETWHPDQKIRWLTLLQKAEEKL